MEAEDDITELFLCLFFLLLGIKVLRAPGTPP